MRVATVLLLSICASVVVAGQRTAPAPLLVDGIKNIKRSVVPVVCVGENKTGHLFLISIEGTGFFVSDDGDVVTAGHVASALYSPDRLPTCPIPAVYVATEGWKSESSADLPLRIIVIDRCWWSANDIGVCKLRENPFTSGQIAVKPLAATLDTSTQPDGTAVAFTGFPLSFTQPITSQGTVAIYRAVGGLGPSEVVVDKNAWPGASGSPLYRADGTIIGMVIQRGFNDASGLAFARTSAYIASFLAKNKADREKAKIEGEKPKL